uniref:AAA+ ATPase domain-containing protein n=1 Tax=Amphora coffeiformis TaxID=265554 RepID=A0A6S8JUK5_9STRA|eukprot:scaffold278_cov195-Amphora_coffeaeformis.AAC.25
MAAIQAQKQKAAAATQSQTAAAATAPLPPPPNLAAALQARHAKDAPPFEKPSSSSSKPVTAESVWHEGSGPYSFDKERRAFVFFREGQKATDFVPTFVTTTLQNNDNDNQQQGQQEQHTDIIVPLAPCVYRMCDYTIAKREPVALERCVLKLGVLRCLQRECQTLNALLWHRLSNTSGGSSSLEEDELGKVRFMELLSNCGVYQKVAEMILQRVGQVQDEMANKPQAIDDDDNDDDDDDGNDTPTPRQTSSHNKMDRSHNPLGIPQIKVDALDQFLETIETLYPALQQARDEIRESLTVSFYPGLGELFSPGSQLLCHPEGMEGSPLGCSCVQSWYAEEINKATGKTKRRFVLVIEFVVSVGDELVFVAASDVYPEFHDTSRNQPIRDLTHRKLLPHSNPDDKALLHRLQQRGEFYASVATKNHYLEYYPDSFFPIIGGGWNSNAVRPLSKGGRVMVDVKRGILEGHMPVRGSSSDGLSDTVKEAIKLFEQSKRTGVAVPFRTAILPGFEDTAHPAPTNNVRGDSDRPHLWQAWPMLTGFSFTARVWGKLLLGMPKPTTIKAPDRSLLTRQDSPRRAPSKRFGVEIAALGGEGSCGNCGYITFQEKAFDQLVLAEDKKELIRAVARNAGGSSHVNKLDETVGTDEDYDDDDDDDLDEIGLDVVANKGGASIFLLHGPPGCGKTLTAEAISELLRKPLYIVTAGDLGITAAEVEKTLGAVLDLCQTWDALVLIDEADIFLEARTSTEIQRNALVCVMLRLLEYYSGCLFLSSNRAAESIDPAIASRITVMLGYPPLDEQGRAKVWKNLIELVPSLPVDKTSGEVPERILANGRRASKYRAAFSEEDYASLGARYELNGRQIKNSIVLARALARERGTPLELPVLHRAVTAVAGKQQA